MKMKFTGNQIRLILCLFVVAIFSLSYQFIYTRFENLTKEYQTKTKETNTEIQNRETDLADEAALNTQTQDVTAQYEAIIASLPVKITKEDNLVFIEQLEKDLGITIPLVDIQDATEFYTTILPIRDESGNEIIVEGQAATDAAATESNSTEASSDPASADTTGTTGDSSGQQYMKGWVSSININFQTTYEDFRKLVDYINNYPQPTSITNASLNYDGSTGELIGSMTINRYALAGSGKAYEEPYIGDISIGTENIFGTSGVATTENSSENSTGN